MKKTDTNIDQQHANGTKSALYPTQNETLLVRHLARMAAEKDYKTFLKSGKIPYHEPHGKGK